MRENELVGIRSFVGDHEADEGIATLFETASFRVVGASDMEGAVRELVAELEASGAVDEEFLETALERERISPTNMTHIAVPHGDPSHVLRTKLAIGKCEMPLNWGGERVSCVLLLACTPDFLRERATVFSTLYRRLASLDRKSIVDELGRSSAGSYKGLLLDYLLGNIRKED